MKRKCNNYNANIKDDQTGENKHELLQYSVRTINNSKVSRIPYPRKMHAFYEKRVLMSWVLLFLPSIDGLPRLPDKPPTEEMTYPQWFTSDNLRHLPLKSVINHNGRVGCQWKYRKLSRFVRLNWCRIVGRRWKRMSGRGIARCTTVQTWGVPFRQRWRGCRRQTPGRRTNSFGEVRNNNNHNQRIKKYQEAHIIENYRPTCNNLLCCCQRYDSVRGSALRLAVTDATDRTYPFRCKFFDRCRLEHITEKMASMSGTFIKWSSRKTIKRIFLFSSTCAHSSMN